jgi:hypothetical protein
MTHTFKRVVEIMGPRATTGLLGVGGTGDRPYGLSDFLCHSGTGCYNGQNMINNPIGIGVVLSILAIIGLIYVLARYKEMLKKENYSLLVIVMWFLFAFYAVNAANMPIKLSPFRAWMLLAIPVSLLAGESIDFIARIVKSMLSNFAKLRKSINSVLVIVIVTVMFYGIFTTSFIPKYKVNTSPGWAIGGFWANPGEEIPGYLWLKDNVPPDTRVFTFSNNGAIIGVDKFICHWCSDVREFQRTGINSTPEELLLWLKENEYDYIVVDAQAAKKFGADATNNLTLKLANVGLQPVIRNDGFVLFKV